MKSINFNFYLKIYLCTLLVFASFFFFQKYNNFVEWTISEWLINYQGGFTRRGLLGEIIFQFSNIFFTTFRETILFFQILTYAYFFYLIYNFLKNTNKHLMIVFAIFSPLFVIYPITEVEVLGRKEIFIFISFLLTAEIFSQKKITIRHYFYFSLILTITCLIWEGILIYLSFFVFILFLKNNLNFKKNFFLNLLLSLLPFFVTFYFITMFRLSSEDIKVMCDSINECYGAMTYLNKNLYSNIEEVVSKFHILFLVRYILIFIVGFFPLILLIKNSRLKLKLKFKNKHYFAILFILVFIPSILFYFIAQDWGRWIHISYSLSLLTYIYCIKNNIISIDTQKLNFTILKNKTITSIIFILFCFSWGPKTLMSDDIGSIPIYRKGVSIIKTFSR